MAHKFLCYLAVLLVGALVASAALADCCPCPIVKGANPERDKKPEPEPKPRPGEITEDKDKDKDKDKTGEPDLTGGGDVAGLGDALVSEDRQQAVISWNGKQQILILTTNEKLLTKHGTAVLHFMPLPGKVKDIYRADKDTFNKAKKLVRDKLRLEGVAGLGIFMEKTIGAHNIFVWRIDDPKEFEGRVQRYVLKRFGKGARAHLTPRMLKVMGSYYKRGFRYFAFDMVLMGTSNTTKEAIGYHFESGGAYYPLVISSAAATGRTLVDMVVFSKGELTPVRKVEGAKRMRVLGNRSVPISYAELAGVDRRMAGLFERGAVLRGRIIQIEGNLQDFKTDFAAR